MSNDDTTTESDSDPGAGAETTDPPKVSVMGGPPFVPFDPAAIADEAIDSWDMEPEIVRLTVEQLEVRIERTQKDIKAHPTSSHWGTVLRLALPMLMGLLAKKQGEQEENTA